MSGVVGRFYVAEVKKFAYNPAQRHVTLRAVSRGPENKEWAEATPTGEITMQISNGSAGDWFESLLGRDIAVTFEERPLLCVHCKKETGLVAQHGGGVDSFSLGRDAFGYSLGDTIHSTCYAELDAAVDASA